MTPIISFLYLGLLFLEVSDFSRVEGSLVSSSTVDPNMESIATVFPVSMTDSHKETSAIHREKPTDSHKETRASPRETPTDSHKETTANTREKPTGIPAEKPDTTMATEDATSKRKEDSTVPIVKNIPAEKPGTTMTTEDATSKRKEDSTVPIVKNIPAEKPDTTMTTEDAKQIEYPSKKVTGIIIGCFVGLFLLFIIFALITILRKKKVNSYTFGPPSKSPEESGIPLNDVTA